MTRDQRRARNKLHMALRCRSWGYHKEAQRVLEEVARMVTQDSYGIKTYKSRTKKGSNYVAPRL